MQTSLVQTLYGDTEHYVLLLIYVNLTLIHGPSEVKKLKLHGHFVSQSLVKSCIYLDGIGSVIETCWSDEPHT